MQQLFNAQTLCRDLSQTKGEKLVITFHTPFIAIQGIYCCALNKLDSITAFIRSDN